MGYLRGMVVFHRFDRTANREALGSFSRAFELDPDFGAALGMAARCYAQRKGFGWLTDPQAEAAEARRLARLAASRAGTMQWRSGRRVRQGDLRRAGHGCGAGVAGDAP
ncbi:hypothetical protein [Pelagibius marinus]|uniref:hypothetical protein n=1 Tax=Pelagibius marinus TaxID=2762760 RepID=UPI0018729C23|nr:hypothetical protein [Pelagibius marinus]